MSGCQQCSLLLDQGFHIRDLLKVSINLIVEVFKFFLLSIFFTCECYIGLFFQCGDPGDKSIPTGWGLIATNANTEEDEDENYGEEIRSVCYVDLPSGREEDGLQGGVQEGELLRGRNVKLVHVGKCEAVQPLGSYMM